MRAFPSIPPILLAGLASCAAPTVAQPNLSPPVAGRQKARPSNAETARPAKTLSDVQGEWDIVEFDGFRPQRLDTDGQRHAYVDIDAGGMRFTIGCNYSGVAGSIGGGGLLIPAVPDNGIQTQMGCGAERETRDTASSITSARVRGSSCFPAGGSGSQGPAAR